MEKLKLDSIIKESQEKKLELLTLIEETRVAAIESEKTDPRLARQSVEIPVSYEYAALAYPWPEVNPPGREFRHDQRYLDIVPYLDKKRFIEDMKKNQVRVVDTGAQDSLLAVQYRLIVLEPDITT